MSLIDTISDLQREALTIAPPRGTDRLAAKGGLTGPAFFPEGLGLNEGGCLPGAKLTIMAIGHNFGSTEYRERIEPAGREDNEATWRNLDRMLERAGVSPDVCFRTNWFVGLLPGGRQTGKFLKKADPLYEQACNRLLVRQIVALRPTVILFLGPEAACRAYQIMPALAPWKIAANWAEIDQSSIGHSVRNIEVLGTGVRINVAALLHPSFSAPNQSRRMRKMPVPITEVEIIRRVLASSSEIADKQLK